MPYILLVDDEDCIRSSIREFLEREGYEIRTAGSAESAIEILKDTKPVLLICDMILPQQNGDSVISELQQCHGNDVPVLVMTGLPDDETEARLRKEFGIQAYLPKPFSRSELLDLVRMSLSSK